MNKKTTFATIALAIAILAAGTTEATAQEMRVADIDGNIYKTVQIGNQIWMAENLKTTRLNNGEEIPVVQHPIEWGNLRSPGLCWYEDDIYIRDSAGYVDSYGFLYNWHAVGTGKLCPEGWHVPSEQDWARLVQSLGGWRVAGLKMKERGTEHWYATTDDVTNESGFTARPGGVRSIPRYERMHLYYFIRYFGAFWSSSITPEGNPVQYGIYSPIVRGERQYGHGTLRRFHVDPSRERGHSVRCIKTDTAGQQK